MDLNEAAARLEIDLPHVLDRLVGKKDFLIRMLKIYAESEEFAMAKDAMLRKDYEELKKCAHALKGAGFTIGLDRMAAASNEVVCAVREHRYEYAEQMFERMEEEFLKIQTVVEELEE